MTRFKVGDQVIVCYPQRPRWIGYHGTIERINREVVLLVGTVDQLYWSKKRLRKMRLPYPQDDYFVYGPPVVIKDYDDVPD